MPINKLQEQSLEVSGLELTYEYFSHRQLYAGMSRAKGPRQLHIIADKDGETQNIVYFQELK